MIFFQWVYVIVYLGYLSVTCHGSFEEDYCWRDYFGATPTDALGGGVDRNGKPIYIGQVLFDNKLIPGKIHENVNEIHIEFHDVHVLKRAIKILCTQHHEAFQWVQTRHDEVLDKRSKHIFVGGYEEGHTTYVGRAVSHGELTIGKVVCHDTGCYKLTTIENGAWFEHDIFEILAYNSEAKIKPTTTTTTTTTTSTAAAVTCPSLPPTTSPPTTSPTTPPPTTSPPTTSSKTTSSPTEVNKGQFLFTSPSTVVNDSYTNYNSSTTVLNSTDLDSIFQQEMSYFTAGYSSVYSNVSSLLCFLLVILYYYC